MVAVERQPSVIFMDEVLITNLTVQILLKLCTSNIYLFVIIIKLADVILTMLSLVVRIGKLVACHIFRMVFFWSV